MAQICDLAQCVDKGLEEYGSNAKRAVHLILTLRSNVPFEQAVTDPVVMVQALQEVFDESSEIVQRTIVAEVRKSFPLPESTVAFDFVDVINHARCQISGIPAINSDRLKK
jgi:hypothetical protein